MKEQRSCEARNCKSGILTDMITCVKGISVYACSSSCAGYIQKNQRLLVLRCKVHPNYMGKGYPKTPPQGCTCRDYYEEKYGKKTES